MAEFQRHPFKDAPQDRVGPQKIGEIYVRYYLYRSRRHFVHCALSCDLSESQTSCSHDLHLVGRDFRFTSIDAHVASKHTFMLSRMKCEFLKYLCEIFTVKVPTIL